MYYQRSNTEVINPTPVPSDLRSLDEYRRSFEQAYATVVRAIRDQLALEPTGRPAKSTGAIIEKLRRESIRLTQIQDVAGCRIVVPDAPEQERVVASLRALFPAASVVDRRPSPSHGYRAVHIIPEVSGKAVEIQVRSSLQHLWAEFSEKLSDKVDSQIKYGRGPDQVKIVLAHVSELIAKLETLESMIASTEETIDRLSLEPLSEADRQKVGGHRTTLAESRGHLILAREELGRILRTETAAVALLEGRRP